MRVTVDWVTSGPVCTGNGFGVQIVGGKRMPGGSGDTGAYINSVLPGGAANKTGQLQAGTQHRIRLLHRMPVFLKHGLYDLKKIGYNS